MAALYDDGADGGRPAMDGPAGSSSRAEEDAAGAEVTEHLVAGGSPRRFKRHPGTGFCRAWSLPLADPHPGDLVGLAETENRPPRARLVGPTTTKPGPRREGDGPPLRTFAGRG